MSKQKKQPKLEQDETVLEKNAEVESNLDSAVNQTDNNDSTVNDNDSQSQEQSTQTVSKLPQINITFPKN